MKEKMNIVIVGHVDHGKSTIIGRLLADTGSLPEGKLEAVKENCARNSKPFEYAFLLDALKEEQAQGITIDAARVFFHTEKRNYIILDAPGHIEFLRNMITGAAKAEAALLVIDAHEGVQENSRRHGYMLSMLGINQIVVLINKMDLVKYDQKSYENLVKEYGDFLKSINVEPQAFVPVSGMQGDNIFNQMENMPWYTGTNVLGVLDDFTKKKPLNNQAFRMPVQGVYKFTGMGDSRRIVAGTIDSGTVNVGDEIIFYPSGKKSKVKTLEAFNEDIGDSASAGMAAGFTLEEQIYISRGELAAKTSESIPKVTTRALVSLFWLGSKPMEKNKDYVMKIGSSRTTVVVEEIKAVIDASTLASGVKENIERHDVAEIILKMKKPAAFDLVAEIASTGRFVIVDNYEISGGGIIRESLPDKQTWARDIVLQRNFEWEKSRITCTQRAEKYNQKAALLLITGPENPNKKVLAKAVEEKLFIDGKFVYYLGFESLLFGLDADVQNGENARREHLRRLGETAHILLDSGLILVITVDQFNSDDLALINTMVNPDFIETIWYGDDPTDDHPFDIHIASEEEIENSVYRIKETIQRRGIIYSPW